MQCPYCAEEIKDEATVCRHCGREFALLKRKLEEITSLKRRISDAAAPPATQQPGNQLTYQPATSNRAAIRCIIDNCTTAAPAWRRITLAVLLSGSIQVLSNQMLYLLKLPYEDMGNDFLRSVVFATATILQTIFEAGSVFPPLVFGFWASLGWPGKHLRGYILLGLSAGLLTMAGEIILDLLGGWLGFPTGDTYSSLSDIDWVPAFIVLLVGPASMFVSGALFGDLAKRPKKASQRERGPGFAYRLVDKLSGGNGEPNRLVVKAIETLLAVTPLILQLLAFGITGVYPGR